ncbi:MAG: hypothetical protein AAGE80_11450 [Pseudomonadota bacterium]
MAAVFASLWAIMFSASVAHACLITSAPRLVDIATADVVMHAKVTEIIEGPALAVGTPGMAPYSSLVSLEAIEIYRGAKKQRWQAIWLGRNERSAASRIADLDTGWGFIVGVSTSDSLLLLNGIDHGPVLYDNNCPHGTPHVYPWSHEIESSLSKILRASE